MSLPSGQWEAIRRLAPEALEYTGLSKALEEFLADAKTRSEGGENWGDEAATGTLWEAFKDNSQPDGSHIAKFYQEHLADQDTKDQKRVGQRVRLGLGRRFLDTLVQAILNRIWAAQNAPECAAEQWFARHGASPFGDAQWKELLGEDGVPKPEGWREEWRSRFRVRLELLAECVVREVMN